ncbi:hypothetical protein FB451DRAFT_1560559 [Mycena latifolia]|nr:hypothetical protein FB451DRAFT_1560559 [Mycena latifolia]
MVGTVVQILALGVFAMQFATASPAPALVTVVAPPIAEGNDTPYPGSIAGVDSLGRTTYVLSDSMMGSDTLVVVTATLVEGSDYMSYTVSLPEDLVPESVPLGAECGLGGGTGVCTGASATITMSALGSWIIDVPQTVAPGSSAPTVPPTGSGTSSAPAPTQTQNSSQKTSKSIFGALVGLALAFQLA